MAERVAPASRRSLKTIEMLSSIFHESYSIACIDVQTAHLNLSRLASSRLYSYFEGETRSNDFIELHCILYDLLLLQRVLDERR